MKQSEQINELAKALSIAQGDFESAKKDSVNPFFKSNYADLTSIINAIKPHLTKHGLSVSQMTDQDEVGLFIETQIMHSSGQWIRGRYPVLSKDNTPQSLGSATSYAKRYALQSALLIPSEDDDAQSAQTSHRAPPRSTTESVAAIEQGGQAMATTAQISRLFAIVKESRWTTDELKGYLSTAYGVKSSAEIPFKKYDTIVKHIQNNPGKA